MVQDITTLHHYYIMPNRPEPKLDREPTLSSRRLDVGRGHPLIPVAVFTICSDFQPLLISYV